MNDLLNVHRHTCDAKVPNSYENEIDRLAHLAGKFFWKDQDPVPQNLD